MALMFQRLVRNYIKNGYFPTDGDTTARILSALAPSKGPMRLLDPCCGEGVALAEVKAALGDSSVAYGIEYDQARAEHAKGLLDVCVHADIQDCVMGTRQYGGLFLNPPYGDLVADHSGGVAKQWTGRKRLEKLFYSLTNGVLQFGGVLVLIIPSTSLDRELSGWIARQYDRVQVFMAPVQTYKQVVVLGVRRRVAEGRQVSAVRDRLAQVGEGELPPVLPEVWDQSPYIIPVTQATPTLMTTRIDVTQLNQLVARHPCLWSQFQGVFGRVATTHRRPLCALSDWHLGLSLAAGQVSGVVTADDGRVFVIKGDTYKRKRVTTESIDNGEGRFTETVTHTDIFVPVIRALDMTPDSPHFGKAVEIS